MPTLRPSRILDPAVESQSPEARRAQQGERLRRTVAHAFARAPRARRTLEAAGIDPASVHGLDDLLRIPVTRKDSIPAAQAEEPPFAGLTAVDPGQLARIFMSPGPIYDPQGAHDDFWRFRHALASAGFRAGDVAHNSASYHLTPLGFMLDAGARALGCAVIPAGVGQTELQVKVAAHVQATAYLGAPQLPARPPHQGARARDAAGLRGGLRHRRDAARVAAQPRSRRGSVSGSCRATARPTWDASPTSARRRGAGTCTPRPSSRCSTSRPASPPGPASRARWWGRSSTWPIRCSASGPETSRRSGPEEACGCGRTTPKLLGLLGRVGDGVKVKGMFIRAGQIDGVMKRFAEVTAWQAVVTRDAHLDRLEYVVELSAPDAGGALAARLAEALRDEVKVKGDVRGAAAGTIPPGAKRIDDRRVWK